MIRNTLSTLVLISAVLLLNGCTSSIHMVNSDGFDQVIPTDLNYKYVEASTKQHVILGFAANTNYVDEARQSLIAQCDGELTAVSTQYSTDHSFLSWYNKILMKGICIQ
ncbi:hypothetical protein [Moritella sp. F3]|uniref:hypothetical protein n=1 Tax=Moritella sp. F3 TaxID=2718882 RepID=UPI0018E1A503|nr:hypothetical protein [Moritella sp. F3]GIC75546.1 hypothetical protein FMO001_02730 [Moritella sp. F1]GIC80691.1 hypothetical protein FMO003_09720 [Moritella sp. F3]